MTSEDGHELLEADLSDLMWPQWRERMFALVEEEGYAEDLGASHAAVLVERKPVLLVTFQTHDRLTTLSERALPIGWGLARDRGWSTLSLVSDGDSWFRDARVYGYFDRLSDDGLFDEFDQVIFYGAGSCGYAAAAFSVAAPGARVLALNPQASLDPEVAEWDDRFFHMRRTSFRDRYGYAPDMLDAARQAVLLYDPEIELDAMHSALFRRPNVLRFCSRYLGHAIEENLLRMGITEKILGLLSQGDLTRSALAKLYRARRDDSFYVLSLLKKLIREERDALCIMLCRNALERKMDDSRFHNSMRHAQDRQAAERKLG